MPAGRGRGVGPAEREPRTALWTLRPVTGLRPYVARMSTGTDPDTDPATDPDIRVRVLSDWVHPATSPDRRLPRWTFRESWPDTAALLVRELEHLGARSVLLGIGLTGRDIDDDGWLSANAWPAVHPGVEMTLTDRDGHRLHYATDACEIWQHNVRAIALGLEALRAVDRYGITRRQQQYAGFRAPLGGPAVPVTTAAAAPQERAPERRVVLDRGTGLERRTAGDRRRRLAHRVRTAG